MKHNNNNTHALSNNTGTGLNNINIIILLLISLLLGLLTHPTAYAQPNSLTTTKSITTQEPITTNHPITTQEFVKNTLQNLPTNANDFSQAYLNPLVGNAQLSTPSGTQFDVELSCPTSNAFLTVMAQVSSTGDLSFVQFSRDKDLDGVVDSVQTFPKAVSGVCATGLISCTPGTWDDCVGYQWDADNDNLSLIATGISHLGGCYCINASCGDANRSQRILSSIVTDLGTAAAQALAQHNPQYLMSGAITTGPIAKFYGQKLVGCGAGSVPTMSGYYQAPQNIEAATNSYQTDANGIYQLVADSSAAQNAITEIKSCTINRNTSYKNIELNDIVSHNSGGGQAISCASSQTCASLSVGQYVITIPNNVHQINLKAVAGGASGAWKYTHHCGGQGAGGGAGAGFEGVVDVTPGEQFIVSVGSGGAGGGKNTNNLPAEPTFFKRGDDFFIYLNGASSRLGGTSTTPGAVHGGDGAEHNQGGSSIYGAPTNNHHCHNSVAPPPGAYGAGGYGAGDWRRTRAGAGGDGHVIVQINTSCTLDQEWITNACDVIQADDKCQLKNELIDGVQTYKNYHPTGKTPIATTQQIGAGSCDLQVSRDWWHVKRDYQCKTNTDLNFDTGINRNAVIQDSATTEHFNDVVDGLTTQRDLTLPDIKPQASCTNACKTKRQKDKVSVAVSGPVTNNITQEWETLYRKCVGDEQNICPNEADETVITQCACLNEFGAASVMMQTLRQAAQGLICTQ